MSLKLNLKELLGELEETVVQIASNVNNMSNSTNRLLLEMSKSTTGDTIVLDAKKHDLLCNSTQQVLNIFSRFAPSEGDAQQKPNIKTDHDNEKFEDFKAIIANRYARINGEVMRVNALNDIVANIEDHWRSYRQQKFTDDIWKFSIS